MREQSLLAGARARIVSRAQVGPLVEITGVHVVMVVIAAVMLLILFTSSLCGYVFAKFDFAFKEVIFTAIISSMMVPFAVVVLPLYLLVARSGFGNTYPGLILPFLVSAFGIFLMRQFMEG